MQKRIHLIRHGETKCNAQDRFQGRQGGGLSEKGRQQIKELRQNLVLADIDVIYCSSSQRAYESAMLIKADSPIKFYRLDELMEIALGPWEGMLRSDVIKQYPEIYENFKNQPQLFQLKGAETNQELQQRALKSIAAILKLDHGREILVVSHGAWIRALMAHYDGRSLAELKTGPKITNASHSIIEFDSTNQYRILQYAGLRTK